MRRPASSPRVSESSRAGPNNSRGARSDVYRDLPPRATLSRPVRGLSGPCGLVSQRIPHIVTQFASSSLTADPRNRRSPPTTCSISPFSTVGLAGRRSSRRQKGIGIRKRCSSVVNPARPDRPARSPVPAAVPAHDRPPTEGAVPVGSRPSWEEYCRRPQDSTGHATSVRHAPPGRLVGSDGLRSSTRAQVPRPARARSRPAQSESGSGRPAHRSPSRGSNPTTRVQDPGQTRGEMAILASRNGGPPRALSCFRMCPTAKTPIFRIFNSILYCNQCIDLRPKTTN